MGASRATGRRLLGVLRDVEQLGATETLRRFNLLGLAGKPAADVFLEMLEFICPPGGALDEAIARQAMLDAINDLSDAGVGSFDTLSPDQLKEFFLDFLARSIEGRVVNDIGARGVVLPADAEAVEQVSQQLHDFIFGCTKGALIPQLNGIGSMDDAAIDRVVDQIYELAFDLITVAAEAAI